MRYLVTASILTLAGCAAIGQQEITVGANNESDDQMVIEVVEGSDHAPDGRRFGEAHTVAPGSQERISLTVPGGDWTVRVNGKNLLTRPDALGRTGELPITLHVRPDRSVFLTVPDDWGDEAQSL